MSSFDHFQFDAIHGAHPALVSPDFNPIQDGDGFSLSGSRYWDDEPAHSFVHDQTAPPIDAPSLAVPSFASGDGDGTSISTGRVVGNAINFVLVGALLVYFAIVM